MLKLLLSLITILVSFPTLASWDNVKEDLIDTALDYGVSPTTLMSVAYIESSYHPKAKNKYGTASGLMQITKPTAEYLIDKYQLGDVDLFNHKDSLVLGALYLKEVKSIMEQRLGREITPLENYLGYKFSPYRATRLLTTNKANTLLKFYPGAAKRNTAIYYDKNKARDLAGVIEIFKSKWSTANQLHGRETTYLTGIIQQVRYAKISKDVCTDFYAEFNHNKLLLISNSIYLSMLSTPKQKVNKDNLILAKLSVITSGRYYRGFAI